jgi:AcrR family transcriptional regulator
MRRPLPKAKPASNAPIHRRPYESPVRQQQAAQTRERIVAAGAELAHRLAAWDWRPLTFKAVGKRANVAERTVHRHFSTERTLHGAILQRLVEESGIKFEDLDLADFSGIVARVFRYLSSFAIAPAGVSEPGFASLSQQRREALLGAVGRAAPEWTKSNQVVAAAMLDMLWSVPSYERLLSAWQLDADRAILGITWVIGLLEKAIHEGAAPDLHGKRR